MSSREEVFPFPIEDADEVDAEEETAVDRHRRRNRWGELDADGLWDIARRRWEDEQG